MKANSKLIVIDARIVGSSTGTYAYRLLKELAKLPAPHQYKVLVRSDFDQATLTLGPQFQYELADFSVAGSVNEQLGLYRLIRKYRADLVHFCMAQQPVAYRGKVVTTMHDLTTTRFRNPNTSPVVYWCKQQVYKWLNKRVAKKSMAIIAPSQFVKDDIVAYTHVSPSKIMVTYEAADKIVDAPEPMPALAGKQFIMYLGRPMPHKNLGRLIDAFVALQKTHPGLYLVLAGKTDANYQRYADRVARDGIGNIVFTGFISEGQLRWLYEHCSAYVFPSLSEGFGLPGLEAMAHGAPVVSSSATCLPEIYGDAAHYFNPLDIQDMASKIADVIDEPNLRDSLIAKGKAQASKYSWEHMAQQTLEIYTRLLGA